MDRKEIMSLRERCIEAGAKAVYMSKWGPSMSGPKPAGTDFHLSANVLDAILGVLTEHADEWVRQVPREGLGPIPEDAEKLLAVLRSDGGGVR